MWVLLVPKEEIGRGSTALAAAWLGSPSLKLRFDVLIPLGWSVRIIRMLKAVHSSIVPKTAVDHPILRQYYKFACLHPPAVFVRVPSITYLPIGHESDVLLAVGFLHIEREHVFPTQEELSQKPVAQPEQLAQPSPGPRENYEAVATEQSNEGEDDKEPHWNTHRASHCFPYGNRRAANIIPKGRR